MTNTGQAGGGGGMPKWVIAIVVVLLVIGLGCCGAFTLCTFVFKRGADAAGAAAVAMQRAAEEAAVRAERQADEARRQAAAGGADNATGLQGNVAGGAGDGGGNDAIVGGPPRGNGGATGGGVEGTDATLRAVRLPTNFPKDLPVYAGLTPTFQVSDNMAGKGGVTLDGKVGRQTVVDYYEKAMKDGGWTQTGNAEFGELTQLQYTKDDRTAVVQVSAGDNGHTLVLISYDQK